VQPEDCPEPTPFLIPVTLSACQIEGASGSMNHRRIILHIPGQGLDPTQLLIVDFGHGIDPIDEMDNAMQYYANFSFERGSAGDGCHLDI
jgi:hypothetical protein